MFETLSETCGLRMFMMVPFRSAATLDRAFAALAAVLPEEVRQSPEHLVVGRMEDRLSVATCGDQSRVDHAVEVAVESRPRDDELPFELGRRHPFGAGLNDRTQDGEARDVAQSGESLGVTLDGFHIQLSRSIDCRRQGTPASIGAVAANIRGRAAFSRSIPATAVACSRADLPSTTAARGAWLMGPSCYASGKEHTWPM